jgi:tripartite-type tricarboxylate transporter receptor subunit TctC
MLPLLQGNKLRALAVMTEKRTALLPNVPSVAELGYRGVDSSIRFALFVPAATPADVVAKLAAANTRALADASLREAFQKAGYDIVSATGPQVAAMVQREYAVWGPIVRDLGLQPE